MCSVDDDEIKRIKREAKDDSAQMENDESEAEEQETGNEHQTGSEIQNEASQSHGIQDGVIQSEPISAQDLVAGPGKFILESGTGEQLLLVMSPEQISEAQAGNLDLSKSTFVYEDTTGTLSQGENTSVPGTSSASSFNLQEGLGFQQPVARKPGKQHKNKRIPLTLKQKWEICQYKNAHPGAKYGQINEWFLSKYSDQPPMQITTVSNILKMMDVYLKMDPSQSPSMGVRYNMPLSGEIFGMQVEDELYKWCKDHLLSGENITKNAVYTRARQIVQELGLTETKVPISHMWLNVFLTRFQLNDKINVWQDGRRKEHRIDPEHQVNQQTRQIYILRWIN